MARSELQGLVADISDLQKKLPWQHGLSVKIPVHAVRRSRNGIIERDALSEKCLDPQRSAGRRQDAVRERISQRRKERLASIQRWDQVGRLVETILQRIVPRRLSN